MKPARRAAADPSLIELTIEVAAADLALAEEVAAGWEVASWTEAAGAAVRLRLYFPATAAPDGPEVARRLAAGGLTVLGLVRRPVGARRRTATGRAGFRPLAVGRRWWIVSPWHRGRPPEDRLTLIINPGTGFGTGRHPSTRLCLRLLEAMPAGTAGVLDLGCGSGILAIAAVRAGAGRAVALDNDPDALENCRLNVALNGLQGAVEVVCDEAVDFPPQGLPWVLANLDDRILARLLGDVLAQVPPGGRLVLGGLRTGELAGQLARCAAAGLVCRQRRTEGGWTAALIERPA